MLNIKSDAKKSNNSNTMYCDSCNDVGNDIDGEPPLYKISISNDGAKMLFAPKTIYLCEKCVKELQKALIAREFSERAKEEILVCPDCDNEVKYRNGHYQCDTCEQIVDKPRLSYG